MTMRTGQGHLAMQTRFPPNSCLFESGCSPGHLVASAARVPKAWGLKNYPDQPLYDTRVLAAEPGTDAFLFRRYSLRLAPRSQPVDLSRASKSVTPVFSHLQGSLPRSQPESVYSSAPALISQNASPMSGN